MRGMILLAAFAGGVLLGMVALRSGDVPQVAVDPNAATEAGPAIER